MSQCWLSREDPEWLPEEDTPRTKGRKFESRLISVLKCKYCTKSYEGAKMNQPVYDCFHVCTGGRTRKLQIKHTISDKYPGQVVVTKPSEHGTCMSPIKIIKGVQTARGTSMRVFSPDTKQKHPFYYEKMTTDRWGKPVLELTYGTIKKVKKINFSKDIYV